MKMVNTSQTLILVAIALLVMFSVSLNAQDRPQDYVAVHNQARAAVNVPPMQWHTGMANDAMNYARQRVRDCQLVESGSTRYGENIARSGGDMSGATAVRAWVNQRPDYIYSSNTCRAGRTCKHYTQVVWRTSVWVGCAKVRCNNGGTFAICYYSLPGNIRGRWPY